jgi:hypothetical protein
MKKKMTLQKATVAAGVVAMSVGLFNSFNAEAEGGSACTSGCLNQPSNNDGHCDEFNSNGTLVYNCDVPGWFESTDCVKGQCP